MADTIRVTPRLVPFIDQQVRWMWNKALPAARSVMGEPLDTALPHILGTDAVLRGLRVRTALTPNPIVVNGAMVLTLPDLGNTTSGYQVTRAVLILSGVPEEAITENDLLGTKTRTLALPLAHESDLKFVAGLLQPTPPSMAPQSVLQVLLAHAAEVDRHARESVASAEMHDLLRQAIASNTVGVDRQLLTRAFDAVVERVALQSIGADASAHLAARVGQLDVRVLADRHPVPAIAPATMAQQVAGSEIRFERLIGPIGIQLVGEMFRRATWESISNRGLGRAEALST